MDPVWLTAIGTLALAVVTTIAVLVAIFQDRIRTLVSRPRLKILLDPRPPDCHKTSMTLSRGDDLVLEVPCYYFRVRVRNEGSQVADTVEVFVHEVVKQQADGAFRRVESFSPLNLLWSHYGQPYFPKIPPQVERYCDLGHILDPRGRTQIHGEYDPREGTHVDHAIFCLELIVRPNTMSHLIYPGIYRFVLVAAAANAKPVRQTIEMNLTGQWFDDEMTMISEGVGLKVA